MARPLTPTAPAYRIETERLVLRCWEPRDAPRLSTAIEESTEHLRPWMPWMSEEPRDLDDRVEFLRRVRARFDRSEEYVYALFDSGERQVLGGAGLHDRLGEDALEIGYWVHAARLGEGLATEAASALTRVAFEALSVERVEVHCDPRNVRSAAVPKKLGFSLDATLRKRALRPDGTRRGTMIWSLLLEEYEGSVPSTQKLTAYDAAGRKLF